MAKLRNKKSIKLWGTGKAKREVIYVDDLADAVIYFMNKRVKHNLINIGTSNEKSIKQYVKYILNILNIKLEIKFDNNKKLDGMKSKVLNTKLALKYGWKYKSDLKNAIIETYKDLNKNYKKIRN